MPQVNREHRQQIRHQLEQGRRPGRKHSGGAHDDKLASTERRDEVKQRPEAPNAKTHLMPRRDSSPLNPHDWGASNGCETLCAATFGLKPTVSSTSQRPPRAIGLTAGP